jgi:hypothetical protein
MCHPFLPHAGEGEVLALDDQNRAVIFHELQVGKTLL